MKRQRRPPVEPLRRAAPLVAAPVENPFVRIAEGGFGDGWNAYAHSMAWFAGALYVGTTRANLCSIKAARPPNLNFWPVRCPDDVYEIDRRAEIWRFDPHVRSWRQVFRSPWVELEGGVQVPRDIGYRGMSVFRGASDEAPALYVCTWAPSRSGQPSIILRSEDGRRFEPVSRQEADPGVNTYRALRTFKGRLYTSPAGRSAGWQGLSHLGVEDCTAGLALVLENSDPANRPWRLANSPSFGDPGNVAVFDLAVFNDHLYAGTVNPRGFQVWKTAARGEPPYQWTRVLTEGAYRGPLNEGVATMCAHDGRLYIGSGIQHGGYDRTYRIGPAAAELLRIADDDSWELLVGAPRHTPDGFKEPLSRLGPGFDNFFAGYLWNSCSHDGWLYVGTYDWSVFLSYLPLDTWPQRMAQIFRYLPIADLPDKIGGFDLWRSRDGAIWEPVTRNGFGNPFNYGARRMMSTPSGLFLGTANPFGPEIGQIDDVGEWGYQANPRGGLEVWWLEKDLEGEVAS